MYRRLHLLPLLALALLGSAHALDAAGLAPALESAFPPSVAYLDCPYASSARTCVLVPDATSVKAGARAVLSFLRSRPAVAGVKRAKSSNEYAFRADGTAYRLRIARSRARPGMIAATLSFAFDASGAAHAICVRHDALFDLARLPSLTTSQYASMATAVTCRGANITGPQGQTPLWAAVASGDLAAVRTLLRGGADPNHIDHSGWTPLLVAARSGTRPILNALLQAGGDPSYVAPDGATLASLEPFNANLASTSAVPDESAVLPELPELPGALPGAAAPSLGRAAGGGPKAKPAADAPQGSAGSGKATVARGGAGPATPAGVSASASTPARPAPRRAATGPAPAGPARPFPSLPLAAVLVAVGVILAVTRARQRAPEDLQALTDTGTEWQAVTSPKPLTKRRRARQLEAARPWNDPLG